MADAQSPIFRFRVWRASLPPALRLLLTINVTTFLVWIVLLLLSPLSAPLTTFLQEHLLLHPVLPDAFLQPWQFVTYAFLDPVGDFWGFIGFLFAMLWLYWMGRDYEETYGSHRLFGLYILAALGGGLMATALPFWSGPIVFGAFGPALAVLCTVAALHPDREMGLFLLGVLPLRWIALGFAILAIAFAGPFRAAYLGAVLTGYLFGYAQRSGLDLAAWARALFSSEPSYGRRSSSPSMGARVKSWFVQEEEDDEPPRRSTRPSGRTMRRVEPRAAAPRDASQDEVDRILDKILERGFDALTDEEKRILDEASRRS